MLRTNLNFDTRSFPDLFERKNNTETLHKLFECAKFYVDDDLAQLGWLTEDYQHRLSQVCKNKLEKSEDNNLINNQHKNAL